MAIEKKRKVTEAAAIQNGRKLKAKSAAARAESEEPDDDEDRPAKKKKKKKKKTGVPMGLVVGAGVGVLVVLIVIGLVSWHFFSKVPAQNAPVAVAKNPDKEQEKKKAVEVQPPPPQGVTIVPGIKEGNPANKPGGDQITRGVRGAGYRTERRSELRQIGLAFIDFCDTHKGANRTQENFLKQINNFAHIRDSVKDGYYTMNMKADPTSSMSIIAYETAVDQGRHMCVMGGGNVDYVPLQIVKDSTK